MGYWTTRCPNNTLTLAGPQGKNSRLICSLVAELSGDKSRLSAERPPHAKKSHLPFCQSALKRATCGLLNPVSIRIDCGDCSCIDTQQKFTVPG